MKFIFLVSSIFWMLPNYGISQQNSEDISNDELFEISKSIIDSASYCVLITLDENGHPRARMMDPFEPQNDLTIWFGTNPKSRKVEQIRNDARVTVYYVAPGATGYVTIHGKATLIDDLSEKEKQWKNKWADFYPNYPNEYLLIKVTPKLVGSG